MAQTIIDTQVQPGSQLQSSAEQPSQVCDVCAAPMRGAAQKRDMHGASEQKVQVEKKVQVEPHVQNEHAACAHTQAKSDASEIPSCSQSSSSHILQSILSGAWLHTTFPGREHAVIGGVCGLIAALLIFWIGVWRVLLIVVCVAVGVAFGQLFDGKPRLLKLIKDMFRDKRI